jgi:hypothetical protein
VALTQLVFGRPSAPQQQIQCYEPSPVTEPFLLSLLQLLAVPNSIICIQAVEVGGVVVGSESWLLLLFGVWLIAF